MDLKAINDTMITLLYNWSKEEDNLDFGFVKNLLRYVLIECYPASKFRGSGFLAEDSENHPLSPTVKSAVKLCLESNMADVRDDYDFLFPEPETQTNEMFLDEILSVKTVFEVRPYHDKSFLEFICRMAEFSVLSYLYGIKSAPRMAIAVICVLVNEMRDKRQIGRDFWKKFEEYCEIYIQDEIRLKKISQPTRNWRKYCEIF